MCNSMMAWTAIVSPGASPLVKQAKVSKRGSVSIH